MKKLKNKVKSLWHSFLFLWNITAGACDLVLDYSFTADTKVSMCALCDVEDGRAS